jgi:hypothetical protein
MTGMRGASLQPGTTLGGEILQSLIVMTAGPTAGVI